MLEEQQPPVFVNPWENEQQQSFRFPQTSIDSPTALQPLSSSASVTRRPSVVEEEPMIEDTPYWLGGPLNEDIDSLQSYMALRKRQEVVMENKEEQQFEEKKNSERERIMNNYKLESVLPYRRHSLAHEPLFTQPSSLFPKRTSLSGSSPSRPVQWGASSKFASSIWSSSSSTSNNFLWDNPASSSSTTPTTSYAPSSQSLFPSRPRFSLGDREHLRTGRRFSLTPLPSMSEHVAQDYFKPCNVLSSVPEELPYRRHSLAGPLLGVATSSRAMDDSSSNLFMSEQQTPSHVSWCLVEFKAGRSEVYYSLIPVEKEDWVIVEADRGRDLGKVVAKDLPPDQVTLLLQSTSTGIWEEPRLQQQQQMTIPTPKRICRLATSAEITLLVTKRQDEQKALLICQTKSKQKKLLMDVVDAEYQWDRRKLTFYFVAERRVDFRELVRDLFKIYKTRIWMCSVNNNVGKKPLM